MDSKNNGGNGHKELSKEVIEELEQSFVHTDGSFDNAFKADTTQQPLHLIMLSDPDFLTNAMRYDFPSMRALLGIAISVQHCKLRKFTQGEEFWKLVCAMMPSIRGKRVNIAADTIIGERKWREQNGAGGFFRGAMDKVFGNNKPQ